MDSPAGANQAQLVGSDASASAANLVAKINDYSGMGVTASLGAGASTSNALINLTNENTGSDGNVTITLSEAFPSYWDISGMAGGATYSPSTVYGNVYGSLAVATPSGTILPTDSTQTENCQLFTQGLWHDYGSIPSGSEEGVFAVIESPSPKDGLSLADIVGMPAGTPFRIGAVKSRNLLEEAVVAVPFFVGQDDRRKYYKLDEESQESIDSIAAHLEKYIFPPRFDFVRNEKMVPVAMYVFEFSRSVSQQDIADMWQNLPPSIHDSFEQKVTTIEHPLLRDQLLNTDNRPLRQDLRWMVFKVKKRGAMDYPRFVKKGLVEDIEVIPSNINDAPYSYNWPYDYFSLVELVKIDEAIEYTSAMPPDSRIEIVGDVNVRALRALPVKVEE